MKRVLVTICLLSLFSCAKSQESNSPNMHTNALINETSPYLLQHAHNPVNWYPWGEEALDKAKKENKLILVSIGYAACHWCHVMEHESFEDSTVAKFMNDNFVAIKVDREERPDIDQVYMNAVQLITGRGGWPLNCIALPDGRPLYGGTYFQKEQWLEMLSGVLNFSKENPEKTEEQANALTEGIQRAEFEISSQKPDVFNIKDLDTIFKTWKGSIDYKEGGGNRAPKFPLPIGYQYLLQYDYLSNSPDALKAVDLTLFKMAHGGIYDQIGGGFARYSTDDEWKVPHFEKMLYDNSQLVSLYASAYQQSKNPLYKEVVIETLDFIERELTHESGGFYSSLDADSEGEEGKFYVWTKTEFDKILSDDAKLLAEYFEVTEKGNWEHGNNILLKTEHPEKLAATFQISMDALNKKVSKAKVDLLAARSKRIRPGLDDKILTSWNALMLKGYVDAYRVTDTKAYLQKALKNADFLLTSMKRKDGGLNRNFKNGKSSINAFLDDYAFSISAFVSLYQVTFDEKWLKEAADLMLYANKHFSDEETGMYFYTSDLDAALVARKMEIADNVIPSSNSEMAKNLYTLGQYLYDDAYIQRAKNMLGNIDTDALKNGPYYANWNILRTYFSKEPYEVAIVGKDSEEFRKEMDAHYLPNVFISGGKNEGNLELLKDKLVKGKTTIYVCQNKVCQYPVNTVKEALELIK
ncbi:thioredoxin domain-containing protein [Arcticibacterium luteifluviistationis]|uniref:Thioredoxin domain-containing protein n=1 Tax=Arcticibacterium luteifluviistationis TaxID=1784714 RepID=A0A2Z4GFF0_9BACT|nr:thioredoxin domain-containing protein [Arcticibacterium luteifluviistationis]AWW00113.1 thioredoxin domain-containing protein [Arcticibacterium luteifluviistationis]